jgi:hypothetical protein
MKRNELRTLNAEEVAMLEIAFSSRINYAAVRISDGHRNHPIPVVALRTPNTDAVTLGNTIYFGRHYYSNFAVAPPAAKCLLFHEMTHVWQWAELGKVRFLARYLREFVAVGMRPWALYRYRSASSEAPPEHFRNARLEAQADMIRDYARTGFEGDAAARERQAAHLLGTGFFGL